MNDLCICCNKRTQAISKVTVTRLRTTDYFTMIGARKRRKTAPGQFGVTHILEGLCDDCIAEWLGYGKEMQRRNL